MNMKLIGILCGLALLAGCHDDKNDPPAPPPTFSVGGTVSGLSGSVSLANNGGDTRTVSANGSFTFATALTGGSNYNVTVTSQPANQNCTLANATGAIAAANVSGVTVTCETIRVVASIGPAGGTVTGPGGAQVVIPAGALSQATDIGVARPVSGWPLPIPEDATFVGSIYELTPHDLIFNKPVVIRLPVPAGSGNLGAFVATFGEGWHQQDVLQIEQFIELERNTFSWYSGYNLNACVYSGPPSVGACSSPSHISGRSWATATPANAIMMTSGGSLGFTPTNTYSVTGSAGTWAVDLDALQTVHLSMDYLPAADCANGHVQLRRVVTGAAPQIFFDTPAVTTNGRNIVTIDIPRSFFDEGLAAYFFRYSCTRANGSQPGGGDWITFDGGHAPNSGFRVGGLVTGLSGPGLKLQIGFRETVDVLSGASAFGFGTPLKDGSSFEVRVHTQPTGVRCTLANQIGTINSADVTNVAVTCTPTQSSASGFAVVANRSSGNFSLFERVAPSGTLNLLDTPTSAPGPSAAAIHPNGIYTYIANQDDNSISFFRVRDLGAGPYQADLWDTVTTQGPAAMAIEPGAGECMWVANNVSPSTVTSFEIDLETGQLYSRSSVASGPFPSAIAVHPSGQFVYTVNQAGNSISMFSANTPMCALTSIGTLANSVLAGTAIEVRPDGAFAYALGGSTIARFSVDTTSGQLTSTGFTSINGASNADDIVIRPDGRFLYAKSSNTAGASLQVYAIDAGTGALTLSSTLALPALGFAQLAVDATGSALYATNMSTGNVHTFRVDSVAGGLTLIDTDQAGVAPQGIAVTP